jgi:pantoate--beta-alanine ligase
VGFVPTMGYLHEGHLSLARQAKKHTDVVVLSTFVNPIQFGKNEDFDKYPRDFKRDEELARTVGVDIVFCPQLKEMYPEGYSTYVDVEGLTEGLCGASRPGHFRGVATVVTKLFGIVKPDIAYFGQKDAQQALVIRKMTQDLNMDVEIKILPTVREKDGLAMSSRNAYLSRSEREEAPVLYQALKRAETLIDAGERDAKKVIKAMDETIKHSPAVKTEYITLVDTKRLKPVSSISGEVLIAIAATIGKTRLIDNIIKKV